MRFVLALLSSFLLLNAQIYAIPAGPEFPGGGGGGGSATTVTGDYSGVLVPSTPEATATTTGTDTTSNSMGIFNLSIPTTGLGTGTFIMFAQGRVFSGTIDAAGDPDNGTLTGVLQATYNYTLNTPARVEGGVVIEAASTAVTASVTGTMFAEVNAEANSLGTSFGRLVGTAVLNVDQGQVRSDGTIVITETLNYEVDGAQQTTTSTGSTTGTTTTAG